MGRRAKNKQGDPLPLHEDPDLNGSFKASTLKSKSGFNGNPPASNPKAKLGKRKPERDDDGERVTKKPKGVLSTGKSQPQAKSALAKRPSSMAKGKSKGKTVSFEEVEDDDGSVGWEDVEGVDVQAEARCVRLSENIDASPNLRVIHHRTLFRDSDTTDEDDEDEGAEEFSGFTGGLEDMESDEDEFEEYVQPTSPTSTTSEQMTVTNP